MNEIADNNPENTHENTQPPHPTTHPQDTKAQQAVSLRFSPPGYKYPLRFWLVPVAAAMVAAVSSVTIPVFASQFINHRMAGESTIAWTILTGIISAILFLGLNEYLGWGTTLRAMVTMTRDWKTYISSLAARSKTPTEPGEIVTIITKDVSRITTLFISLPLFTESILIAVIGAVQLWLINPLTAIITFFGTVGTVWVLTVYSKFLEKRLHTYRTLDGQNTSRAADVATGLRTITGLGAEEQIRRRYRHGAAQIYEAYRKYMRTDRWMYFTRGLLTGLVALLAVAFTLTGRIQDEQWVTDTPTTSLVTVAGIVAMMGGPIWVSQEFITWWRQAKISLGKIADLEVGAGVRRGVLRTPRTDEEMAFYTRTRHTEPLPELPQVSARALNPRIVYLDPRPYGMRAQEYTARLTALLRKDSTRRVLLSESNPVIFAGTLREHLRLGATTPPDPALARNKDEFLLRVTDSLEIAHRLGGTNPDEYYDARISSEGANLSGGQRQRLALARALAQDAHILVLTEPLNSVDEPSQRYIYNALEQHLGEGVLGYLKTVYIISTTVEVCRRITRDSAAQDTTIEKAQQSREDNRG